MKTNNLSISGQILFFTLIVILCALPVPALAEKGDMVPDKEDVHLLTKPAPETYDLPNVGDADSPKANADVAPANVGIEKQWRFPNDTCDCEEFIQDDERLPALVVIMDNGGDCDEGDFELLLEGITRDWFDTHWDDPGYYEEYVFIENPGIDSCNAVNPDSNAAQNRITTQLQNLNDSGYFMDIVVLTHGSYSTGISIIGDNLGDSEITDMSGDRDQLAIRMVYQMNCFGQFLNDGWMDLGAQVVSGSRYVNFLPILFASVFNNRYLGDYACPISINIVGLSLLIPPIPSLMAIANTAVQACASSVIECGWLAGETYYESVNDCMYDTFLAREMADRVGNLIYNTKTHLIDAMTQDGFDAACDALGYDCDSTLSMNQRAQIVYWSSEPVYDGNSSLSLQSAFEGSRDVGTCDKCPAIYDPNADRSDSDSLPDVCDNCPDIANDEQTDSDSDGLGDECDNCPEDYNPLQINSDGDDYGNACDYPDLVLDMEYSASTGNETGDEIEMSWVVSGRLRNEGTDPIDAGTVFAVIWEQEVLLGGQGSQQSTQEESDLGNLRRVIAVRDSEEEGPQVMIVGPNRLSDDDESGSLAMAAETVFDYSLKRIETIELNSDLNPNSSIALTDQQFQVTVGSGDCAEVTFVINVDAANLIKEINGNDDNEVRLTGYSFWGCGGEMDEGIIDSIIDGIIGPEVVDDWLQPDTLITEAEQDKIIQHVRLGTGTN